MKKDGTSSSNSVPSNNSFPTSLSKQSNNACQERKDAAKIILINSSFCTGSHEKQILENVRKAFFKSLFNLLRTSKENLLRRNISGKSKNPQIKYIFIVYSDSLSFWKTRQKFQNFAAHQSWIPPSLPPSPSPPSLCLVCHNSHCVKLVCEIGRTQVSSWNRRPRWYNSSTATHSQI